jgi:hypothetical protein
LSFRVERHAAGAVLELGHFTGLDVVEAVDAGDTVADRQHLPDFGDLGLWPKILDLVQGSRKFPRRGCPSTCLFHRVLDQLSLVRSELSTMRLPSLTTRPPMMEDRSS